MENLGTLAQFDGGDIGGFIFLFIFVFVIGIGGTVLWILALIDAVKVPDDSMYRSGGKTMWILVIVLTGFIGAIIYYAAGRPDAETRARIKAGSGGFPGAVQVDYRGVRFALGRTATSYTIWDTAAQNAAIRVYPLTAEGWNQAWQAYYQELEGQPRPGG